MGIVPSGNDVLAYSLNDDECRNQANDEEDASVDDHMQEITFILWSVAICRRMVGLAHAR